MENDKLVWKKAKYSIKDTIINLFKEPESVQIEKEARRQIIQETEDRATFTAELEAAHERGIEKATKGGMLTGVFKSLTDLGGNVNKNMTARENKKHRRSEPNNLLEGIL